MKLVDASVSEAVYKGMAKQFILELLLFISNVPGGGESLARWESSMKCFEFLGLVETTQATDTEPPRQTLNLGSLSSLGPLSSRHECSP